jgi:Restriction endonuclease
VGSNAPGKWDLRRHQVTLFPQALTPLACSGGDLHLGQRDSRSADGELVWGRRPSYLWQAVAVDLDELLGAMDRTAANLAKLDDLWRRAASFIPNGPAAGSAPEYDDLCRAWNDLLAGLPPIDGWTMSSQLPDIDALGRAFIDYADIGEHPFALYEEADQPGKDLAEYRYRFNRARRRAARERLQQLVATIDIALPALLVDVPRDSRECLDGQQVDDVTSAIGEIERLMGDTAERKGRWGDLHRHLYFGQGHDWHDIREFDWPSVRSDVEAGALSDTDPLPVPDIDLGHAATGHLTGVATLALPWDRLNDDGFERLLYDLLRGFPEHENVQWLMQTRAPDRGRDLSLDRSLRDGTGGVRTERVIVQAKHWLKRSVGPAEVAATLAAIKLWEPPVVRGLVIATSGRFSADAVDWAERHNSSGAAPLIELWPESKLETLLAQKPYLAAAHGLR